MDQIEFVSANGRRKPRTLSVHTPTHFSGGGVVNTAAVMLTKDSLTLHRDLFVKMGEPKRVIIERDDLRREVWLTPCKNGTSGGFAVTAGAHADDKVTRPHIRIQSVLKAWAMKVDTPHPVPASVDDDGILVVTID